MPTECSVKRMGFARVDGRAVVADFDGGAITSNAGGLLLGAADRAIGLVERFAACFIDGRAAERVVHEVATLVGHLFADRTSAATMRANQLRMWFASMAYGLVAALRRIGLAGTELATATCGSIRLKLLKIGALVTRSVRRVRIAMASSCPDAAVFRLAHTRLCG